MAHWNSELATNANNISLHEFTEFGLNSWQPVLEETFKMQYEVITFFESHYVLVLMIAMHWKVVVWLKSCRYTLTRDPAIVWGGRRERVSCRWTIEECGRTFWRVECILSIVIWLNILKFTEYFEKSTWTRPEPLETGNCACEVSCSYNTAISTSLHNILLL